MDNFWTGFEKRAAARSEILGTAAGAPIAPITVPAAVIGRIAGTIAGPYSKKDQEKINKKTGTNLIPGVGMYRHARRGMGVGLSDKERAKE